VTVSVDPRSGRIVFQDGADVIFQRLADGIKAVNDNPALLAEVLVRLKVLVRALTSFVSPLRKGFQGVVKAVV
jgi:hypothetical protein